MWPEYVAANIIILVMFKTTFNGVNSSKYSRSDLLGFREEVREMFNHAYNGYLEYAYPYDELRPLTCDGIDTWGSYSLTLIDALDTLVVMGNYTEFERVVNLLQTTIDFDIDINVSVFETNIRIIGGLLSAHILSHQAGIDLEPNWPCDGPLLRLAVDVTNRILPAFNTTTGMPYGTVNLKYGVPKGETSITCTAGIGTFILEFGTLSKLTGNPIYEKIATKALYKLYTCKSNIDLVGNHIDVLTAGWTALDSGIGAGVDSYFEYLVKGSLLFNKPELMSMFKVFQKSIDKYLKHENWYFWASMFKGMITLPIFQSLEAYWPGVLSHIGNVNESVESIRNYHSVWKQFGFTPEYFNILHQDTAANRGSYPLRPELAESIMYLYRATGNPYFIDIGIDILRSIQHSAITECGYATIRDCRDHSLENRMESFFLAETTKYLYLLFDTNNFIHNTGVHGTVFKTSTGTGNTCLINAGGYIFNTEAHPIDPGILDCCVPKPPKLLLKNDPDWSPKNEQTVEKLKIIDNNIRNLNNFLNYFEYYSKNDTANSEICEIESFQKSEPISVNTYESILLNEIHQHTESFLNEMESIQRFFQNSAKIENFGSKNKKFSCTILDKMKYIFINNQKQCMIFDYDDEDEFYDENLFVTDSRYEGLISGIEKYFNVSKNLTLLQCDRQPFIQRLNF